MDGLRMSYSFITHYPSTYGELGRIIMDFIIKPTNFKNEECY